MTDREKVVEHLYDCVATSKPENMWVFVRKDIVEDALDLLKEQEKKRITLHKKHGITWRRNDEFSMGKLYEAICETLLDEGELFIARTDNHEKVDFVFYVAEGK